MIDQIKGVGIEIEKIKERNSIKYLGIKYVGMV